MNTIESSIRSTLTYYEDAREMWMVLKGRFCVVNGTRIYQLKSSLADCKQGKTESVASYFGRISKIWDDLATYVKLPTCSCDECSCGGCTCGLAAQYQKLLREDRLHWFLVGVDGVYASARSQLLNQDPLPSLDRAYQVLTQEENLRGGEFQGNREDRDTMMAMKVQSDGRGKSKVIDNFDKFCVHCNRKGHDESSCFQLHGFPDWWGDRPRGGRGLGRGGRGGGRGSTSGGRGRGGSTFGGGWKTDQPPVRAHKTTNGTSNQTGGTQRQPRTSEQAGLANITPEQWQNILDLLNLPKPKDRLNGPRDEAVDWSG
ncbi:Retrovirus-related Pol polyprotein from transposon TNT 1-94 [Melia azedarach]|uniref:Retrovirus-related Pol polyprotein from transposon TNT 1-94 n=1 Tax=Melia azedarach TaxID=155640 RepID=A0ACC1Y1S2_MELAZ|nr:Retrovirus-related Pol polyprotein from transposon TNT 1-94 [Melia azedarach]